MPAARSRIVALATGLALAATPGSAGAFAPPESTEPETVEPPPADPPADEPATEEPESSEDEAGEQEPEIEVEEQSGSPSGGGMIGAGVDPDDPNAKRAKSDLEGESLDDRADGVPERLPKLQAAGWWLVFGGVTLAAAGGVLAGIAETREDEAERLAYGFDFMTGLSTPYGSVADEWEQTLREGQAFESAARGLVIAGGVVVLAGIGLFIADGVQRKRGREEHARVRVQPSASGVLLRF
jgi:hypothetical protein